jgi:acyl-CoA synthetase (AMP-forming)/AMP-acid ligase II
MQALPPHDQRFRRAALIVRSRNSHFDVIMSSHRLKQKWKNATGQILLERCAESHLSDHCQTLCSFGMTEIGMAISAKLDVASRHDAHIGWPLPGVQVRLWDLDHQRDVTGQLDTPGELQIKSDNVFKECACTVPAPV